MTTRLLILQRILLRYREDVFFELSKRENLELLVAYGDHKSKKYNKYSSIQYKPRFPHKKLYTISFIFDLFGHINQFFFSPGLLGPVKEFKPDVVLTEGTANIVNNFLLCSYCLVKKIPYIWWDLGHIRGQKSENIFRRILYPIILFYARRAALILGYSTYARDHFVAKGFDESRIVVAFNTVRLEHHIEYQRKNQEKAVEFKKKLGMENDIVFLSVGGLERTKRFDLFIDAYVEVHKNHQNIGLIIVGDGPERESLEQQASYHDKIYFAGAQFEEVGLYFMASDIFVLAGIGGLAINEAMVYGLPVISAPADGTEVDLIKDFETGFMIGIDDRDLLIERMNWFIENADRIQPMGAAAKKSVLTTHSFEKMIDLMEFAVSKAAPKHDH